MSDGCLRNGGFDFVIASGQCDGRSLLLFECPRGTVRHSEQCLQSQRGASLRLTEETHLGRGSSRRRSPQVASALTRVRGPLGKLRTRRDTTACEEPTLFGTFFAQGECTIIVSHGDIISSRSCGLADSQRFGCLRSCRGA